MLDDGILAEAGLASGRGVPARGFARLSRRRAQGKTTPKADPDFERKHPRGRKGTSQGGKFVRKGSSGAEVRAIQKEVGVKPTGTFDGRTAFAVKKFQRAHGLQVDGVVGSQTAGLMRDRAGVKPGSLSSADRSWLRKRAKEKRRRPGLVESILPPPG